MDNGLNTPIYSDDFSLTGGAGVESVKDEGISSDPDNLNTQNFDQPSINPLPHKNIGSRILSSEDRPNTTSGITPGSIMSESITPGSITSEGITPGSITSESITPESITQENTTPNTASDNISTELEPILPPDGAEQALSMPPGAIPDEIDPLNPDILSFPVEANSAAENDANTEVNPAEKNHLNAAGEAEGLTIKFTSRNDGDSDPAGYFEKISALKELDNPEGKAA